VAGHPRSSVFSRTAHVPRGSGQAVCSPSLAGRAEASCPRPGLLSGHGAWSCFGLRLLPPAAAKRSASARWCTAGRQHGQALDRTSAPGYLECIATACSTPLEKLGIPGHCGTMDAGCTSISHETATRMSGQ
jgi:hypothetical protein